jgi:hypothetical protein
MKNYMLSVITPQTAPPPADVLDDIMRNVYALEDEMKAQGAWVFSGGLDFPARASVARKHGDDVLWTDGPFVEAKEYLGGFTIVQSPDDETAREWGRRMALIIGLPIEVRPFVSGVQD